MSKTVNVAYFAFSENYGDRHAGFTHTYNIALNLGKFCKKLDVLLAYRTLGLIASKTGVSFFGVVLPSLHKFLDISSYVKSYFFIKKNLTNMDIVHERFHVNPIDLLFIGRRKYILEINDPAMVLHDSFFYRFLINLKLRRCDFIITQTQTLKNILQNYTDKPIYVISNGVDTKRFMKPKVESDLRKKLGVSEKDILVTFVGAFMPWHGVYDVVKLAKNFPKVKFLMIGNGPEFFNIKRESRDLNNLILVGSKNNNEIPSYLFVSDINLAPFNTKKFTKLESFGFWWCPVKLFEYMASGKPTVSYDYPEVRNIVRDGGLLAKPGDFDDLNEKLKKLIDNVSLRKKLGVNAKRIALKYDWKYRAKETYEVYEKCLKK